MRRLGISSLLLMQKIKALTCQCPKIENSSQILMLKTYCDSDDAGDKEIRSSVTVYSNHLHDCLIAWK